MPAPVPGTEGMRLVHDHGSQASEQPLMVHACADEHGLERFRRGEQQVGQIGERGLATGRRGVTVPERNPSADPCAVGLQPGEQVVQQRLQRAQIDDREAVPALLFHRGQHGKQGGFGLSAGGRCEQERVAAVKDGGDGLVLQRAERRPAEAVHQVVDDDRVEPPEP